MSVRTDGQVTESPLSEESSDKGGSRPLFDLSAIDLSSTHSDKAAIEKFIPHRGAMSLLDRVVWFSEDLKRGVAMRRVRDDEFWVAGHFPDRPMLPGVLMIETAAQLACYQFTMHYQRPLNVVFLRIEHAAFRNKVVPGDDFFVLCQEVRFQSRRFISDIQGLVNGKVCFDARISGMTVK